MKKFFRSEQSSISVKFCYHTHRDFLRNQCVVDDGWNQNFQLKGGSSQTSDTIRLYSYFNNLENKHSTNLFLRDDVNEPHLTSSDEYTSPIFLPGKLQVRFYK